MASAGGLEENVSTKFSLPVVINSPTFIDFLRSPTWIYPTSRFFGDALYEYHYDIDLIECDDEVVEKRKALYESYCDLVGCLIVLFCKEYNVESSKVFETVVSGDTECESDISSEKMLNLVRAAYGIDHFSYLMTSYCNSYKVRCCQDVLRYLSQVRVYNSQKQDCKRLFKHVQAVMLSIIEKQLKVKEFLNDHKLILTDKIQRGPFISNYGIKLHDPLFQYESSVAKMRSLSSKVISGKRITSKDVEIIKVGSADKSKAAETKDDPSEPVDPENKSTSGSPPKSVDIGWFSKIRSHSYSDTKLNNTAGVSRSASPTANNDLFVFQFDSNLTRGWSPHQSMPPTPKSPSPPILGELSLEPTKKPEETAPSKATRLKSRSTGAIRSSGPPLDVNKLEAALEKLDKSRSATLPPSLSPKALSPTSDRLHFKFTSSAQNVSTTSPPLSPDTVFKSRLSPESPRATGTSRSNLKLRLGRSPSPPLGVRMKHSPTSPSDIINLPSSYKEQQEYLLNEYDHRIKMHIAYQAANFELQNAIGRKKELTALIFKQKQFEQEWPFTRSKAEISSYSEHISITTVDEPREEGMEELIKEAKELIKSLQNTLTTKK